MKQGTPIVSSYIKGAGIQGSSREPEPRWTFLWRMRCENTQTKIPSRWSQLAGYQRFQERATGLLSQVNIALLSYVYHSSCHGVSSNYIWHLLGCWTTAVIVGFPCVFCDHRNQHHGTRWAWDGSKLKVWMGKPGSWRQLIHRVRFNLSLSSNFRVWLEVTLGNNGTRAELWERKCGWEMRPSVLAWPRSLSVAHWHHLGLRYQSCLGTRDAR